MPRTACVWLLLGAIASSLSTAACTSCRETSTAPDAGETGAAAAGLTPEQAAQVLAKVGDRTITVGDYQAALEHMGQFDRLRYQSPERRKELLEEMIQVYLLADEATAQGYDKDPLTQQELRTVLRDALFAEVHKGAPAPDALPAEEVRAYFDAHQDEYRDPERRRIAVIVLRDEATAKQALEAAKRATTNTQWGEIVRSKSIDQGAKLDVPVDLAGDVGLVSPPGDPRGSNGRVPEEVRAAAFEIPKVGNVLGRVVKADGRFYVVRFTQKAEARARTFAEAERSIRIKLSQDKMRATEDKLLAELRKQLPVEIDENALSHVKVELGDAGRD
jgi:DNA-directed RNA polymerase subunit F